MTHPLDALRCIALRYATTCTYDALKVEDMAREGLEGANMVLDVKDVTEMLSVMASAYEKSRADGAATHNALLRLLHNRLATGRWTPMSLPSGVVYNEGEKGAT